MAYQWGRLLWWASRPEISGLLALCGVLLGIISVLASIYNTEVRALIARPPEKAKKILKRIHLFSDEVESVPSAATGLQKEVYRAEQALRTCESS